MKSKKFVLIICEGPTDENALYSIMKGFFYPNEIRFHISHGDPLTAYDEKKNPMTRIRAIVNQEKRKYALRDKDILAVLQITDTDGAFIPFESIVEDESAHRIVYESERIRTRSPGSIAARNRKKQANIDKVLECRGITEEIPYRIYFNSRNIEHALYGEEVSLSDGQKARLADAFAEKYRKDWRSFLSHVMKECNPLGKDYDESWQLIRKENASLLRHTNINFLFEEFSCMLYET